MSERATIYQATQIGVESAHGTGVAANKKFSSITIQPAVKADLQKFRVVGNKLPTIAALNKEWVTAKVTGFPTYDEIVYLLSSVLNYAAPAQQGGTTAYKWTHNITTAAEDTYKSFTVEQGDAVRAHKFAGGTMTDLGMNFSRGGVELDGTMIGLAIQDGITMTSTPTTLSSVPILSTQVDVRLADTQAGLAGASALTRAVSAGFSISNRYTPFYALASGVTGWTLMVEGEPTVTAKLKLEADATGMGLLTQMRAGSSKFMQIKAVGALADTGYYYTFQAEFALKVTQEPSEFSDEDGIFAIEWNFDLIHDATWGKGIQIEVTNLTSAL